MLTNPLRPLSFAPVALVCVAPVAFGCGSLLEFDELSFGPAVLSDASVDSAIADASTGGSAGSTTEGGITGGSSQGGNGTGGTSHGTGGTGGSAGAGGVGGNQSGGSAGAGTGGNTGPCASVTCPDNAHCEPATASCVCDPGFVSDGGGCSPAPPGDPTQHTEAEVCDQWNKGHEMSDPSPWSAGPAECDPGTLTQAGITDTLARITMFRWMVGLGPVTDDPGMNEADMYCAAVSSWNPPASGYNPHAPTPDVKCYSQQGASGAGSSNIAWGPGHPAAAIDQFVVDWGNETTFGHRRWIFNPALNPVGIGYYAGGGPYGDAMCLGVFGSGGSGPVPTWISFPPPGFAPTTVVNWTWTFHHHSDVSSAQIKVTKASDGSDQPMQTLTLQQGYGSYSTIAFAPTGWAAVGGDKLIVELTGVAGSPITYEVTATDCL